MTGQAFRCRWRCYPVLLGCVGTSMTAGLSLRLSLQRSFRDPSLGCWGRLCEWDNGRRSEGGGNTVGRKTVLGRALDLRARNGGGCRRLPTPLFPQSVENAHVQPLF